MKKEYITPCISVIRTEMTEMLCSSLVPGEGGGAYLVHDERGLARAGAACYQFKHRSPTVLLKYMELIIT